jgi:hypothetical protein
MILNASRRCVEPRLPAVHVNAENRVGHKAGMGLAAGLWHSK